jgi:UDP-N-acetylglucosamine--N-acetylmuramyl-(pentapeptide) pyrophosphoryl-undecaprenol N-acetylglucosamine transferase
MKERKTKNTNIKKVKKNIVIATGGTGGHIFPAKAFAKTLLDNGYGVTIIADEKYLNYVKENEKIDYKIIFCGRDLKNIKDIKNIVKGFFQTLFYMRKESVDLVIGFGGYASLPTLLVAKILKKEIIIHEQNAYIGKINKFFSKYARIIATSYREFYGIRYDDMEKIRFTGVPVRKKIVELSQKEYLVPNFSKDEKLNILVLGGSGGAKFFGEELVGAISGLDEKHRSKINVVHQCREEDIENVKKIYGEAKIKSEVKPFFDDIDKKIEGAHLVIARAGASSIAEFTIAGKPMILIPFPFSANDHQLKNAKSLESKNAAILIEQNKFEKKEFSKLLSDFIDSPKKLQDLAKKSREQGIFNANTKLLDIVEDIINE